jgi:glutamate-ammonia-ligase adenylyltransferase
MRAELGTRMAAAGDLETALDTLRRFRHEEFLRIGVHDIEGSLGADEVERQLSDLAEVCLEAALALGRRETLARAGIPAEPPVDALVVLGMGKLGGAELNYASDLDLIFIYEADPPEWWEGRLGPHELFTRIAQRAISALQTPTREGIAYRIDTRLRPSGNQGPLVSSLDSFAAYHATSAQVWERQALIKARPIAGPAALRAELARVVDRFVYGRGLARAEVEEIARMRGRIERERGGGDEREVRIKTGRGGLVDVEFLVQMLQLRHGHDHPSIRCARRARRSRSSRRRAWCAPTRRRRSAPAMPSCARSRTASGSSTTRRWRRWRRTPRRFSRSPAVSATAAPMPAPRSRPTTPAIARRSATSTIVASRMPSPSLPSSGGSG